jgi:hypothetical protein
MTKHLGALWQAMTPQDKQGWKQKADDINASRKNAPTAQGVTFNSNVPSSVIQPFGL